MPASRQVETGPTSNSAQESSLSDEEEEEEEIKEDDEAAEQAEAISGVLFQESLWIDLNTIEPDNETPKFNPEF